MLFGYIVFVDPRWGALSHFFYIKDTCAWNVKKHAGQVR